MTVRPLALLAGAFVCTAPILAAAHRYGPPPAHTGGFGEKTCIECHFDNALNETGGILRAIGFPESYEAGRSYEIEIELQRTDLELGGFQAAVRVAEGPLRGSPGGLLEPVSAGLASVDTMGVRYVQHTIEATRPTAPGVIRWKLRWTAPDDAKGRVVLDVAANASNGDDSPFGDHIYAIESGSVPVSPRPPGPPAPQTSPATGAHALRRSPR